MCVHSYSVLESVMMHLFFFLMIRRPPRSTLDRSSAASDVYKRQGVDRIRGFRVARHLRGTAVSGIYPGVVQEDGDGLSLIHISEPTRPY